MKKYTSGQLTRKFYINSFKKQTTILWQALEIMQQYNGRYQWECVFMAMGYERDIEETDTWYSVKQDDQQNTAD